MANFFVDSLCPVSHPSSHVTGANSNQPNPSPPLYPDHDEPGLDVQDDIFTTTLPSHAGTELTYFFEKYFYSYFPGPDTDNLRRPKLTVDKINPWRPSQSSSIPSTPI